jgi:hypothetical protein
VEREVAAALASFLDGMQGVGRADVHHVDVVGGDQGLGGCRGPFGAEMSGGGRSPLRRVEAATRATTRRRREWPDVDHREPTPPLLFVATQRLPRAPDPDVEGMRGRPGRPPWGTRVRTAVGLGVGDWAVLSLASGSLPDS